MLYFWAGRDYATRTDGIVSMAEVEVYSAEDAVMFLDDAPGDADDLLNVN